MDEIKGIRIVSLAGEKEYGIEDSEVREELANVVDGAPEELDSFKEAFEKFKEGSEALAGIVADVAAVGKAIIDEAARAEQAEQTLDDKITAEADRARGAEQALDRKIDEEARRATEAEEAIVENTDKKIAAEVDKIKDGDTIVGQAREIHSRNGKTVADSFLARTTAGSGTIGDGVASLKQIGGNIVKNLATLANFKEYNSNIVKDADIYKVTRVGTNFGIIVPGFKGVASHKYYTSYYVKGDAGKYALYFGDNVSSIETIGEVWVLKSAVITYNGSGEYLLLSSTDVNVNEFFVAKTININLTEIFGAGKEPDKATCDKLFGTMDALPQGLTIANPTVFISTGFNQFNPDNVLEGKAIVDNAIVSGDKKIAVIPCLPCKVGTGENNGYCIHGDFGDDIKVYLTPLNPMEVDGELYMHELTKDATTDTYVPLIKGYMLVEVPTTANLCAHFLWSEDKCERDTYEPYFESKVELPVIPQMSEWGLAGIQAGGISVLDCINFDTMTYTKKIRCVDMGTLVWVSHSSSNNIYRAIVSGLKNPYNDAMRTSGLLTTKYSVDTIPNVDATFTDKTIKRIGNNVYVRDTSYTDVNVLKAALQGVMLYYELATPEEYPLPKVDNNYISSDYGVEQFDSNIPCNANNLYYMRSLAGETRNFLDRMYDNTDKTDAKEVADYITNGIEGNKELATNAPNLALRALFVAAGAEYNDTDSVITKTTPWGDSVEHLPKHYYLNGLGDINEEEMVEIYAQTYPAYITNEMENFLRNQKLTDRTNVRTNLRCLNFFVNTCSSHINMAAACYNNDYIEVFMLNSSSLNVIANINHAFYNTSRLKHIIGNIEIYSPYLYFLSNCASLETVTINKLKTNLNITISPNIRKASILYIINNAAPTSVITITLHADAYARLANDADIVAALVAQPLITLVSA